MYQITEAYRTKMFDNIQTHKLSGLIGSTPFSDGDVIGVTIKNQCSDKNLNLGSVNTGSLKLTFIRDLLDRGDYQGKIISLSDSLLIGYTEQDEEIWETIPLGSFYVSEAVWTAEGMVDITAYDCLSLMDKTYPQTQINGELFDYCKLIETETGAVFGMTRAECEALTNGDVNIAPYTDNDVVTYRDLLSKLSQLVGGFAFADRDGTWKIKAFDNTPVLSIPEIKRFRGSKYSDFETAFDGLSYQDVATTGETYFIGNPNGFLMELGNNPFLQYGSDGIVKMRATAIFEVVRRMNYTPYSVSLLPAFAVLDLGDVVSFTNDYTGGTSTGAVMSIVWTYGKSFSVQCFGINPNLRNAQSKTDKAVKGVSSTSNKDRITTFTSANIQEIEVGAEEKEILRTYFTTSNSQPLLTLTEVKFALEEEGEVELHYYLNNERIDYYPVETYSENGIHTFSFMYPLTGLDTNFKHKFAVFMTAPSGAVIEPLDARTYIQGYGFDLTSEWVGIVECEDSLALVPIGSLGVVPLIDECLVSVSRVEDYIEVDPVDSVALVPIGGLPLFQFSEEVSVYMENAYLITEDSEYFITFEDGEYIEVE